MRPPICAVCDKRDDAAEMTLVRFADYEALPHGMVGHPKGLEWFCENHIAAAEAHSHLPSNEAIRAARTPLDGLSLHEIISLVLASVVPALGVLFLGWSAREIAFVMTAEVVMLSAVLGWLFNYPERSTGAALLLMAVFAPTGLLMATIVARGYDQAVFGSESLALAKATWLSLLAIVWAGVVLCRAQMSRARRRGVSLQANNAVLMCWIVQVFTPFLVLVALLVAREAFNPLGLATLLGTKALIDVLAARWLGIGPRR